MDAVNFSTENKGVWYYFDENNHELGGVCLRELTAEQSRLVKELSSKSRRTLKNGKTEIETYTDETIATTMTFDYCIVDWKNVSIDGHIAECSLQNKQRILKSLDFIKFISSCLESLVVQNRALDEARLKNLENTLNGSVQNQIAKDVK